jgi:ankyrin repeat protein
VDVRSEEFNETALHAAAWYGRSEMVARLLEAGADVNAEAGRPFGLRPLDWALRGSRHADQGHLSTRPPYDYPEVVRRLLAAGARPPAAKALDAATDEVAELIG